MPSEERPNSIPFDEVEWLARFIREFELEFNVITRSLESYSGESEISRIVLYAVKRLLSESGMRTEEMLSIIADDRYGWTDEKNARRFELIEKKMDDNLSGGEAWELESLTEQLRYSMKDVERSRVEFAKKLFDDVSESIDHPGNATN